MPSAKRLWLHPAQRLTCLPSPTRLSKWKQVPLLWVRTKSNLWLLLNKSIHLGSNLMSPLWKAQMLICSFKMKGWCPLFLRSKSWCSSNKINRCSEALIKTDSQSVRRPQIISRPWIKVFQILWKTCKIRSIRKVIEALDTLKRRKAGITVPTTSMRCQPSWNRHPLPHRMFQWLNEEVVRFRTLALSSLWITIFDAAKRLSVRLQLIKISRSWVQVHTFRRTSVFMRFCNWFRINLLSSWGKPTLFMSWLALSNNLTSRMWFSATSEKKTLLWCIGTHKNHFSGASYSWLVSWVTALCSQIPRHSPTKRKWTPTSPKSLSTIRHRRTSKERFQITTKIVENVASHIVYYFTLKFLQI